MDYWETYMDAAEAKATLAANSLWDAQLAKGQRAEHRVAEYYTARGFNAYIAYGRCVEADIVLVQGDKHWMLEVKDCERALDYGKLPIELSYRGRPSGILATRADNWVFVVGDTAYSIQTPKLHELVELGGYRVAPSCNGETQCCLIPIADIELHAELLELAPHVA